MLMTSFCWAPAARGHDTILGGARLVGDADGRHFNMTGALVQRSDDGGRTWREPCELRVEVAYRGRVAVQAKVVERAHAHLLLPAYGEFHPKEKQTSILVESRDGGGTWQYVSVIAGDPAGEIDCSETCLAECPSGDLVAFVRTGDPSQAFRIARSSDAGATWTVDVFPNLAGHPHKCLRLPDGNVLLVYGHRLEPGRGIRAVMLDPECAAPGEARETVIRDDGKGPDIGYPDVVALAGGNLLVVYYWHADETCRIEATELVYRA
jgi:hypothetical protein